MTITPRWRLASRARPFLNVVIPPRVPEPLQPGATPPDPDPDPAPEDITTQAETTAWLGRLAQTPTAAQIFAGNVYIKRSIDHGWWPLLKEAVFAFVDNPADKYIGAKGVFTAPIAINTIHDNADSLGLTGVKTGGDPEEIPEGLGIVNTGKKWSDLPGANHDIYWAAMYVTTDYGGPFSQWGAVEGSNSISLRASSGYKGGAWFGGTQQLYGGISAVGFHLMSSMSATTGFMHREGVDTPVTVAKSSLPFPNANIYLLNYGASSANKDPNTTLVFLFGTGDTPMTQAMAVVIEQDTAELVNLLGIRELIPPVTVSLGPSCWTNTTLSLVTPTNLNIKRLFGPPVSDASTGANYPCFPTVRPWTAAPSSQTTGVKVSTWTLPSGLRNGGVDQRMWSFRGNRDTVGGDPVPYPMQPNDIMWPAINLNGGPCRTMYDQKRLAVGATKAFLSWLFGAAPRDEPRDRHNRGYLDWWEFYDGDSKNVITYAYAAANPATVFSGVFNQKATFWDGLIIGDDNQRFTTLSQFASKGVGIDLEHSDSRSEALFVDGLIGGAEIIKDLGGSSYWYSPHVITRDQGARSGWTADTANEVLLAPEIDNFYIVANRNKSLNVITATDVIAEMNAQLAWIADALTADPTLWAKISLKYDHLVGPNEMTPTIATAIRNWLMTIGPSPIKDVLFLGGGNPQGGGLTRNINQCLAILFGLSRT